MEISAYAAGQFETWPSKDDMASTLRAAGLRISVGAYAIRVEDCAHFLFQQYGDDMGSPVIDADAETVEEMVRDVNLVSLALAKARMRHRFEIYDAAGRTAGYRHYDWPLLGEETRQP